MDAIKTRAMVWAKEKLSEKAVYTERGSLSHLFRGSTQSVHSQNIKLGGFGPYLAKEMIKNNKNLHLLECGIHNILGKNIDIDLIWEDTKTNTIYYRELKANIELDTEKTLATVAKIEIVTEWLKLTYPLHQIDSGLFGWSVWCSEDLPAKRRFKSREFPVDYFYDFCALISMEWDREDFYGYFPQLFKSMT